VLDTVLDIVLERDVESIKVVSDCVVESLVNVEDGEVSVVSEVLLSEGVVDVIGRVVEVSVSEGVVDVIGKVVESPVDVSGRVVEVSVSEGVVDVIGIVVESPVDKSGRVVVIVVEPSVIIVVLGWSIVPGKSSSSVVVPAGGWPVPVAVPVVVPVVVWSSLGIGPVEVWSLPGVVCTEVVCTAVDDVEDIIVAHIGLLMALLINVTAPTRAYNPPSTEAPLLASIDC